MFVSLGLGGKTSVRLSVVPADFVPRVAKRIGSDCDERLIGTWNIPTLDNANKAHDSPGGMEL